MTPTAPLSPQQRVVRVEGIIQSDHDGAILALEVQSGNCFSFSGSSAKVWALLENPVCADEIARVVVTHYEIDEASAAAQTLDHLARLHAEGLIAVVPA